MNNSSQQFSESPSTSSHKLSKNLPPDIPLSENFASTSTLSISFPQSETSTSASGVKKKKPLRSPNSIQTQSTSVPFKGNVFHHSQGSHNMSNNESENPQITHLTTSVKNDSALSNTQPTSSADTTITLPQSTSATENTDIRETLISTARGNTHEKEKVRFSIVKKTAGRLANVFNNTPFQSTPDNEDEDSQKQNDNHITEEKTSKNTNKKRREIETGLDKFPTEARELPQNGDPYHETYQNDAGRRRSRSRNSSKDGPLQKAQSLRRESRSFTYVSTRYRRYSPRVRSRSPRRYGSQKHYSPRERTRSPIYRHRKRSRSPNLYRYHDKRVTRSRSRSPSSRYQHYEPRRRHSQSRSRSPNQEYEHWSWRSNEYRRSYKAYDSYRSGHSKSRSRSPYSSYRRRSSRSRSRSNSTKPKYRQKASSNWSRDHYPRMEISSRLYHNESISVPKIYEKHDLTKGKTEQAQSDRNNPPPPPPPMQSLTPTSTPVPPPPPPPPPLSTEPNDLKPPPPPPTEPKVKIVNPSPSLVKLDNLQPVLSVVSSSSDKLVAKSQLDTALLTNGSHGSAVTGVKSQSLDIYEKIDQVGEGTYGKVYKARNRCTGAIVALKRIRMESEKEGFPVTAMREIKLLQSMNHKHIIKIHEIAVHKGSVYMVLDYMDYDLTGFLAYPKLDLNHAHIKCLMKQILEGIHHLHAKNVLHRDIKGSNILMNRKGEIKLADFGLARIHERNRVKDYTNRVITLWYRPPELLLGATKYGAEVDIWSVGCIMMELFLRKPIFQGSDEITQLEQIYRIMGAPNRVNWPSVVDLPWFALVRPKDKSGRKFRDYFKKNMTPAALDLAEWLLTMDPTKRPTAKEALNHPYFTSEEPEACPIQKLPTIDGDWHEYESKQRKKKQALDQAQRNNSHTTTQPSKEPRQV